MIELLPERQAQIVHKTAGGCPTDVACGKASVAGSVSQRACVFCGSRVVLYPISDALHVVHGPIGCASYTWDIRGALSSGPQLHRNSFSTDLQELDIVYGGEKKLESALLQLIDLHQPKAAFVYATCISGLIGDDVGAVCKRVSSKKGIPVMAVNSEGFKGTKKDGYRAACEALHTLTGTGDISNIGPFSINILGDFNLAGETWIIREYYKKIGIDVVACITGDARVEDIRRAHGAKLNLVQCSGSMTYLAKMLEKDYGIPFKRVSYFGIEDTAAALYDAAKFFSADPALLARAQALVKAEIGAIYPQIQEYRRKLEGKKAAVYVGGAFKAFSLIRALRLLGMKTALVGSQTGDKDDYRQLQELADPGTIIVDDSNPLELARFCQEKDVDLFIGGVKERPIAYKLGIGFCDHNHERKEPLAGFIGMLNFAKEVYGTVMSPVWQFSPRRAKANKNIQAPESSPLGVPASAGKPSHSQHASLSANTVRMACSTIPPAEAGTPNSKMSSASESSDSSIPASAPAKKSNGCAGKFDATRNACKVCAPLGACLVFRGVEDCIPFLHGSQGCSTYIRRYLISHFREPIDIASSNFHEESAVFGGRSNFEQGVGNVARQYQPQLIGAATTCLAEVIGEDMRRLIFDLERDNQSLPPIVHVSTPSFKGTHIDGFHAAVRALVENLAKAGPKGDAINLFPGMVSAADLRHLKEIIADFGLRCILLPDYSDTMDGKTWEHYEKLSSGGTKKESIAATGAARLTLELGRTLAAAHTAGQFLLDKFDVPLESLGMPIGIRETDRFMGLLAGLAASPMPVKYEAERGRLIDSFIDAHKYVFEKRALVYGDEDLTIGLTSLLCEMGLTPVLVASGAKSGLFESRLRAAVPELPADAIVREACDFADMTDFSASLKLDLLVGNSKGGALARQLGVPLIRTGFPIHDRIGGQRILHFGYRGAQQLFDEIVNTLMERKQDSSTVGYSYL
jgi:nitrogenase molybdenum-cofactor synthesis protein NifE